MKKLLIVDDSSVIRTRIAELSKSPELAGLEVVATARHGGEALHMARQYMPDLVTLDLTMPNIDGINCIRELMRISPQIRVLVISSLTDKKTALKALSLGALGFLQKPFSNEGLLEALQEIMRETEA